MKNNHAKLAFELSKKLNHGAKFRSQNVSHVAGTSSYLFKDRVLRVRTLVFQLKVISYGKPVLKAENRGFSTFAGVFEPGNGRIEPDFLELPPATMGEASNAACHFLRIPFFEKLRTYSSFLKISFGRDLFEKKRLISDETSICSWKSLIYFFSESSNTVKNRTMPLEKRTGGSGYLSPKDRKDSEKSEPSSVRLRV